MRLFKIYTDYELSKDPRTITARATENRKFAVENNNFFYIGVEEALSRVETMCGPFKTSLDICLSTDGLPISSSTNRSGISGCVFFHERNPKPMELLEHLVAELSPHFDNGYKKLPVSVPKNFQNVSRMFQENVFQNVLSVSLQCVFR